MTFPERTPRQRIRDLLSTMPPLTSRQIAEVVDISEGQVEDNLVHIVKSIARDRTLRFILEPPECKDCDFVFRERERITRPSRCPKCHSEAISEPRYSITRRGTNPS
jgi:transcriptional regulator